MGNGVLRAERRDFIPALSRMHTCFPGPYPAFHPSRFLKFLEVLMRSRRFHPMIPWFFCGLLLVTSDLAGKQQQAQRTNAGALEQASPSGSRPNIVLILVDDLGFADIGSYGGEIETPNLDRLARGGIRFTQFYNCAKCETTRSTLLSGRYYGEVGNQKLENCITLAEGLQRGGYQTLMVGKWHLQGHPMDRGFDRYFGHLSGATNFFTGDDSFRLDREKFTVPKAGFYTTDANIDYALRFLQERPSNPPAGEQQSEPQPFFLYVAFNAPHYPLQAPEQDVRKYLGKYLGGWDELRKARFARQQALGLFPKETRLTPRPDDVPAWETLSPREQQHEDLMMATFAAMVDSVDRNVGRLLKYLEEQRELDNTLILFLSDNGACPFQRSKQNSIEQQLKPWDPASYWTYDRGWAHACNTPFREYKQNQHEGGINTPFIAHWPAGIDAALANRLVRDPAHLVDLMPTLLQVAGTDYPRIHEGRPVGPARGTSLVPVFSGKGLSRTEPLLFSFYGKNNALRSGDWKIVNRDFGAFELYDLGQDRTELDDLAGRRPEKLAEMKSLLESRFQEIGWEVRSRPAQEKRSKRAKNRQNRSGAEK